MKEINDVLLLGEYSTGVKNQDVTNRAYAVVELFKEIIIEEGIEKISYEAFLNQSELKKVTLPSSLEEIGSKAFKGCGKLREINLSSETEFKADTFEGCKSLPMICHNGTLVLWPSASGEITIPDSITEIGNGAFYGCTGLTSVVIPDSVTEIGGCGWREEGAIFKGCTGLTSIVIPDSVTVIGNSAFEGCTGLTSIVIPDSVTVIGDSAFYGCTGLTSVVIPDSVTEIGGCGWREKGQYLKAAQA